MPLAVGTRDRIDTVFIHCRTDDRSQEDVRRGVGGRRTGQGVHEEEVRRRGHGAWHEWPWGEEREGEGREEQEGWEVGVRRCKGHDLSLVLLVVQLHRTLTSTRPLHH